LSEPGIVPNKDYTNLAPDPFKALPTLMAGVLILAYGVVSALPAWRRFFDLVPLPPAVNLAVAGVTLLWVLVQRAAWRGRWLERLLDLEEELDEKSY
jgi:hypothetical protein